MTLRAAGTSLSGQAVTDGLLVEVARHWRTVKVEDGGKRFRAQPGVIGASVNNALRPYRVKMGPDPASINTCTMGGILSNNSSGMCCGVTQNAYHTLESLTFLLPSGTRIDTAAPDADARFRAAEPALWQGILDLKARLEADPALAGTDPVEVPDEEHDRLLAQRLPRLRDAGRDLPEPPRRGGGDARLHRGGGPLHRARPPGQVHRPPPLPDDARRLRGDRPAARLGGQGARAPRPGLAPVGRDASPASRRRSAPSPTAPPPSSSSTRRRRSRSGAGSRRSRPRPSRRSPSSSRPASRTTRRSRRSSGRCGRGRSPRSARPARAARRSSSRTSPSRSSTSPTPPST